MTDVSKANWIAVGALVLSLVAFLVSGLRSYSDDTGKIQERLSIVETQQKSSDQRMERIENKIDRVLERLR